MRTLADVAVGDWVLLPFGYSNNDLVRKKVVKVTKLHIVLEGSEDKWRVADGHRVGDTTKYWRQKLGLWDEERWRNYVIERRKARIIRELTDFRWSDLNSELAAKIHAMLPKPEATNED